MSINITKNLISFLDTFIYYARVIYGDEKGRNVYIYYMENAHLVGTNMKFFSSYSDGYFKETRHILQTMECNMFSLDDIIYYINHPYDSHPNKSIDFYDFLKAKFSFYENRGEFVVNDPYPTRLFFSKKIIEPLVRQKDQAYFSKDFHHNNFTLRKEELYRILESNKEDVSIKYKKNYRDLSRTKFRDCVTEFLNQKDGQHLIDSLWYDIRVEGESLEEEEEIKI